MPHAVGITLTNLWPLMISPVPAVLGHWNSMDSSSLAFMFTVELCHFLPCLRWSLRLFLRFPLPSITLTHSHWLKWSHTRCWVVCTSAKSILSPSAPWCLFNNCSMAVNIGGCGCPSMHAWWTYCLWLQPDQKELLTQLRFWTLLIKNKFSNVLCTWIIMRKSKAGKESRVNGVVPFLLLGRTFRNRVESVWDGYITHAVIGRVLTRSTAK